MSRPPAKEGVEPAHRVAFGQALRSAMEVRHLIQTELATIVGSSQGAVSGWVGGLKLPAPAMVFTIESILELPPGALSQHLLVGVVEGLHRADGALSLRSVQPCNTWTVRPRGPCRSPPSPDRRPSAE